jgi:CheY-like chemotaxis protein
MDVQMPEMDGFTATRSIRAGGHASLPIIALTANAFPEDAQRCRDAGMSDFLAKPLRKPLLVNAILRAMQSAQPDGASSPSLAPSDAPAATEADDVQLVG